MDSAPDFALTPHPLSSLVNTTAHIMEDELMFSMEEEEGSATRPSRVQCSAPIQRASSLTDASDDEDDNHFICPILDDSAKDICSYLKNLAHTRQLSNSLPKSNFAYKVNQHDTKGP